VSDFIDSIDEKIIRLLQQDGRQSTRQLSTKLGLEHSTIYRRIQRMLTDKTVKILAVTEPNETYYPLGVVLGLNVAPGRAPKIMESLVKYKNLRFISTTTGRFDILAFTLFHNEDNLADFMSDSIESIVGITAANAFRCLKIVKGSRLQYKANESSIDGKIITQLHHDGRQSYKAIASYLNVKPSVVYRRLNHLQEQGLLKITAVVDVNRIGNRIAAVIGINTLAGYENAVCQQLARFENIVLVSETTGIFSVYIWTHFPSISDLYRFLEEELGKIKGIKTSETFLCLKVGKGVYINL
jgi:Lrp/AsnC family transcriptional regulator for asnA, asnC and gidA